MRPNGPIRSIKKFDHATIAVLSVAAAAAAAQPPLWLVFLLYVVAVVHRCCFSCGCGCRGRTMHTVLCGGTTQHTTAFYVRIVEINDLIVIGTIKLSKRLLSP